MKKKKTITVEDLEKYLAEVNSKTSLKMINMQPILTYENPTLRGFYEYLIK